MPLGRLHPRLSQLPLGTGDGEVRMKIKCRQSERIQVPFLQRPMIRFEDGIAFNKNFQARLVQPAQVELRCRLFRRQRPRVQHAADPALTLADLTDRLVSLDETTRALPNPALRDLYAAQLQRQLDLTASLKSTGWL